MTTKEIMAQLESMGSEQTKKVLIKHGAREPFFGVKVADLKKIVKQVKKNYELSLELYATGNSDAMYLAGLISEPAKMTREQLQNWADNAYWYYINEYTVPWVTSESNYGWELANEWINSDSVSLQAAGWATFGSIAGITNDEDLDIEAYSKLLDRVGEHIHEEANRTRHTMNHFIIAVGSYITELTEKSKQIAAKVGKVHVEMGGTACKVPLAADYIKKVEDKNKLGKKRKSAIC